MTGYVRPDDKTYQELQDIAHKLRVHSITATEAAASGHPTSCSSIAEIMSVLFFRTLRIKITNPRDPASDRLVLSKGHAPMPLYACWAEAGLFAVADLQNFRKLGSDLEGHPTPRLNFIDVATGSLGQGLSIACGMAYVGKYYDKASYRVYCILGDGETAEGAIWEALHFASHYKLDNLCVIVDVNRLGQSEATVLGHDLPAYQKRFESFGIYSIIVNGHDIDELMKAFYLAAHKKNKPTAILAKTYKGRYFPHIEDQDNWHGKPLGVEGERILKMLNIVIKNPGPVQITPLAPINEIPMVDLTNITLSTSPNYKIGDNVATRYAYGTALVKISQHNSRVIAFDADTKNSTYAEKLKKFAPSRYVECFIAEQNMVGVAIGATCRGRSVAFVSTFGAFLTRAFDQIRMGAISQTNVNFVGSHCGISIGQDGPSQMALEDLAMFRSIPGSTIFYPSDAVSCEKAVEIAANTPGITFIRTSRPTTPVIYSNDQVFRVGSGIIVKISDADKVLFIGCGVILYEGLLAYSELSRAGIKIRIVDPFTIKPLDRHGIIKHANACGGRILVVEEHYYEGGLGEAVLSGVAQERNIIVKHVAIPRVPRSGPGSALLEYYKLDAKSIVDYVRAILLL